MTAGDVHQSHEAMPTAMARLVKLRNAAKGKRQQLAELTGATSATRTAHEDGQVRAFKTALVIVGGDLIRPLEQMATELEHAAEQGRLDPAAGRAYADVARRLRRLLTGRDPST